MTTYRSKFSSIDALDNRIWASETASFVVQTKNTRVLLLQAHACKYISLTWPAASRTVVCSHRRQVSKLVRVCVHNVLLLLLVSIWCWRRRRRTLGGGGARLSQSAVCRRPGRPPAWVMGNHVQCMPVYVLLYRSCLPCYCIYICIASSWVG
jgi:hypothetical protein